MKNEIDPSPEVGIDKDKYPEDDRIEEELDVSTYRHESGDLYAEDVD